MSRTDAHYGMGGMFIMSLLCCMLPVAGVDGGVTAMPTLKGAFIGSAPPLRRNGAVGASQNQASCVEHDRFSRPCTPPLSGEGREG